MDVSVQVNTKGFEQACAALAKISGRDIVDVVKSEITALLNKTIDNTYAANKSTIDNSFNNAQFTSQPLTLYTPRTREGADRRAAANTFKGKLRYYLENRYPDQLWGAIQTDREKSRRRKYAAIGLAKKSWWEIGRRLGLPVKGGRFASAVATTDKEYPQDYSATQEINQDGISVAFINAQPTVNSPGVKGAGALQAAINGRVKYFLTNMKKGVFDSMQQIARAYPGLKLTP